MVLHVQNNGNSLVCVFFCFLFLHNFSVKKIPNKPWHLFIDVVALFFFFVLSSSEHLLQVHLFMIPGNERRSAIRAVALLFDRRRSSSEVTGRHNPIPLHATHLIIICSFDGACQNNREPLSKSMCMLNTQPSATREKKKHHHPALVPKRCSPPSPPRHTRRRQLRISCCSANSYHCDSYAILYISTGTTNMPRIVHRAYSRLQYITVDYSRSQYVAVAFVSINVTNMPRPWGLCIGLTVGYSK